MPGSPNIRWTQLVLCVVLVIEVLTLNGPNVCMVKQKYNITKLVKYRAPMSIRTYEWCFSMPPRCSKWNTEMRDLTKLETEERIAEVAVCCPGYKMRDVTCVPICPNGKTGPGCSQDCPQNKWGPNCVNNCKPCEHGFCSPIDGECWCEEGWQGESCEYSMPTTPIEDLLTTTKTTVTTLSPSTMTITTSIPTSIKTLPTTTRTPNTESITVFVPITENVITKETIAPIEIKLPTTIRSKDKGKAVSAVKTKKDVTTTERFLTTEKPTTVKNFEENFNQSITYLTTNNTEIMKTSMIRNEFKNVHNNRTMIHNETDEFIISRTTSIVPISQNITPIVSVFNTNILKNDTVEENLVTTTVALVVTANVSTFVTNANVIDAKNTTRQGTTNTYKNDSSFILSTDLHKEMTLNSKPVEVTSTTETTIVSTKSAFPLSQTTQKKIFSTHETTTKLPSTTIKFKPKEIWIKPAQKGDPIDLKTKINHEPQKHKPTNKEISINTTPKTIIVSIIPTSVSYATFRKIALTTAYVPSKINTTLKSMNKTEQGFTRPMPTYVTTTSSTTKLSTVSSLNSTLILTTIPKTTISTTKENVSNVTTSSSTPEPMTTKSMTTAAVTSNITISTNTFLITTPKVFLTSRFTKSDKNFHWITAKAPSTTNKAVNPKLETVKNKTIKGTNKTLTIDNITTETPGDEETFHILTEPEHITAVMSDKENDRTSMDLKSVISIAGGVMMAVITVAVVIVMIERCRRPRYEDVRKINDIRMQVMIDGNDVPPPYVRSIFHTPLPEPPMTDKCHYQPISTLDRNLKQFMRPVVVQTISPIMLENFRGILECHYDHLPRRSFQAIPVRCSVAPSECCEMTPLRSSGVTDTDIDAMKCEARLDEIDNTTAEPLYAEIPCWRPPSEHAVEIMNMNGEAVTEL